MPWDYVPQQLEFFTVEIEFMDGTQETVHATFASTHDDQLHVRYKGGEMAPTEHIGSYPLVNIKKWRRINGQ